MPDFDKNPEYIIIVATAIFLVLVIFIIIFMFQIQRKNQKYIAEKHLLTSKFNQELLQAQLEIQEQTLKNISLEIHDNIGQTLSLAKLNLNTYNNDLDKAEEKLAYTKSLVSKAITDLRNLSKSMNRDTILSSGLLQAIEYELLMIKNAGEFNTVLHTEGNPAKLNSQKELIVFRIVQESLNNIIKHSSATGITVKAIFRDHELELSISDNGKGFDPSETINNIASGSGLKNMRNRAEMIGGSLNIETSQQGTRIIITTPTSES